MNETLASRALWPRRLAGGANGILGVLLLVLSFVLWVLSVIVLWNMGHGKAVSEIVESYQGSIWRPFVWWARWDVSTCSFLIGMLAGFRLTMRGLWLWTM